MLNTLIKSEALMARLLPMTEGELQQTPEGINVMSYYLPRLV